MELSIVHACCRGQDGSEGEETEGVSVSPVPGGVLQGEYADLPSYEKPHSTHQNNATILPLVFVQDHVCLWDKEAHDY